MEMQLQAEHPLTQGKHVLESQSLQGSWSESQRDKVPCRLQQHQVPVLVDLAEEHVIEEQYLPPFLYIPAWLLEQEPTLDWFF